MAMKNPIDQPPPATDWFAANAPPAAAAPRYNTTPTWQDPYNPPSPGDPYWADWIAANPNYAGSTVNTWPGGPLGPGTTTPPPTTGGGPSIGSGPIGPAMPTTGFGAVPDPYHSTPWTGGAFVDPTMADVTAMPGYQTRLDAGLLARQRSAAAQGTILSGGTQKALTRYGQDYAANEFQTARNNAYENYMTRYNQWAGENARTLGDYTVNTTNKRNAETDYWTRLATLYGTGASAAAGSYKL